MFLARAAKRFEGYPFVQYGLLLARECYTLQKPAHLGWEEAVTIPMAYLTAWYSLFTVGRMEPGDRVLIHAGAGGAGIAAIKLALHRGCEV